MAKNLLVNSITALVALTLILELVSCMNVPSTNELDYDNLRDLYEMLLRNSDGQAFASGYHNVGPASNGYSSPLLRFRNHQMERKGGNANRQLRLRFGKRSDRITGEGEFANSYLQPDTLLGAPIGSIQLTSDQGESKMK